MGARKPIARDYFSVIEVDRSSLGREAEAVDLPKF